MAEPLEKAIMYPDEKKHSGHEGLSDVQIRDSGCFRHRGLEELKESGARFLKAMVTFRARKAMAIVLFTYSQGDSSEI